MQTKGGIHTVPESTAYINEIVHLLLAIPIYPLQHLDRKNLSLLRIDNREYYKGKYKKALEFSGAKYQSHLLAELGMPETIESNPQLVSKELNTISDIIDDSFQELQLVSFEDKIFQIVHKLGMSLVVSADLYILCVLAWQLTI